VHDCVFYRVGTGFTPQEQQLCEQLLPHLIESQAINRLLGVARLSSQHRGPHRSLGIVDSDGVLHYQEGEFGVQLRREWPDWQGSQLPAPLCRALLEDNQELFIGRLLVLTRTLEDDLLILRVRPRLPVDDLSARQLLVALQVARGLSHKEVARALAIAPATVRNHIQAIHSRLRVHNSAELVEQLQLAGY
jgi:DNA-binding CsgD family transcriptional regulator